MKLLIFTLIVSATARNLKFVSTNKLNKLVPCEHKEAECICPGACLVNSTAGCYPMDCWDYDKIEGCTKSGKQWLPAMILQAIPFTGAFGSGFGNMGRWDIFNIYITVVFAPCAILCLLTCYFAAKSEKNNSNEKEELNQLDCMSFLVSCLGMIWALGTLAMWIWGIVTIGNNEFKAPWTDYQGNDIQCYPVK